MCFPDETNFHVYFYVNKHDVLCWALENPEIVNDRLLRWGHVTVWVDFLMLAS
jgi:hypothetical protein